MVGVKDVVRVKDAVGVKVGTIVGDRHLLPPLPLQGDVVEVEDKVVVSSPTSLATPGKIHRRGRGRSRGRGCGSLALTFPNCTYSLSNAPPYTGDLIGPTRDVHDRDSTAAAICMLGKIPLVGLTINGRIPV